MPPTLTQRLRRLMLHAGNRRLDFRHPAARALLALAAAGALAALGAAAWVAHLDNRDSRVVISDPREAYVAAVRNKIQAATEAAFTALGRPDLKGSPQLLIRVNARGRLIGAEVARSSGEPVLDELAVRIVQRAEPFEPFSLEMRRTTNIVEITSDFSFQ